MELERATLAFQAAAVRQDDGSTVVEGWGEIWGSLNDAGRVFVPGVFKQSIRGISEDSPLPMGWQHEEIIGGWGSVKEKAEGLFLSKGRIPDTGPGTIEQRASTHLRSRNLGTISIGFHAQDIRFASPNERMTFETPFGTQAYKQKESALYIVQADLREASLVMVGAQKKALVTMVQGLEKAERALPVLQHLEDPEWEDAAYSMALLMGGRGAAAFSDLPADDRFELYRQVATAYTKLGKSPPTYDREPEYAEVAFQHDEREVFSDRYLRKNLATAVAGARGIRGSLSEETRQVAQEALEVLGPLTQARSLAEELSELTAQIKSVSEE